jgi:hypothetical protein
VAVFCVDTAPLDNTCNGTITPKFITTQGGTQFRYYAAWNGLASSCTGSNCTTAVRLDDNAE